MRLGNYGIWVFRVYGGKCLCMLQIGGMVGYGTGSKLSIESVEIIARA
ncbi:hypothetical protein ACE1CD_08205 [Aerosakkonema sp. BLCC-F183]